MSVAKYVIQKFNYRLKKKNNHEKYEINTRTRGCKQLCLPVSRECGLINKIDLAFEVWCKAHASSVCPSLQQNEEL